MHETTFLVMLPAAFVSPLDSPRHGLADVTAVLGEWAALLDPVRAMRDAASWGALDLAGWSVVGQASVSTAVIRLARDAGKDNELRDAVAASPLQGLVRDGRFREQALPLLLGLAVVASLRLGVGLTAANVRRKRLVQRATERAESSTEGAGAAEATQGLLSASSNDGRPTLSPLRDDVGIATSLGRSGDDAPSDQERTRRPSW